MYICRNIHLYSSCGQGVGGGGQEWPLGANVKPHISYLWPLALEPTHGDHGGVTLSSLIGRVGKADQRVFCMKKLREWVDAQYISRRENLANKQVMHIDGKT